MVKTITGGSDLIIQSLDINNLTLNNLTLSDATADRAVVTDADKKLVSSAVTTTELGYVSGVTSSVQTQLNAKQDTITGAASISYMLSFLSFSERALYLVCLVTKTRIKPRPKRK